MNIALITAAGTGSRMNQDLPKQFINVDDVPIIIYTLQVFERHPSIDAIIVVTLPAWKEVLKLYAKQFNITKLKDVIDGGDTGPQSIRKGIQEISIFSSSNDSIIIHDGNRCAISADIITNCLVTYNEYGDAVTVIPCVEAAFISHDDGHTASPEQIKRNEIFRVQTPYIYSLKRLMWMYEKADKDLIEIEAPCVMMQKMGEIIHFSKGSEINLKITTTDDLHIFKALLHTKKSEWLK